MTAIARPIRLRARCDLQVRRGDRERCRLKDTETGHLVWEPSHCRLRRLTGQQARQCLSGRHIAFVGDSVTRWAVVRQHMSALSRALQLLTLRGRQERSPSIAQSDICLAHHDSRSADGPGALCQGLECSSDIHFCRFQFVSLVHFLTQLVYPERYGRDDAPSLVIPHQYGVTVGFDWDVYYQVRVSHLSHIAKMLLLVAEPGHLYSMHLSANYITLCTPADNIVRSRSRLLWTDHR